MSAEIERLMSNMIRVGVVAALDEANARVKMRVNGLVTDWMPFNTGRAGATRTWSAPRIGEQLVVFAPYGDTGQAFAGQSVYQDDYPAPVASMHQEHVIFPDGSTADYNSASNTLTITVNGGGNVIVNCKHTTINTDDDVTVNTKIAIVNASISTTVDTPITTLTGDLKVVGSIDFGRGLTGREGAHISGDIVSIDADVIAMSAISLALHKHREQGDLQLTTKPV
ncbi:phage baseplate assembly protein V [Massilia sp. DJPM01]|uniref:phage baseplate assembly protein V n=1 Tax=Massilia sp. DJPM01 TaxID=3024404 RepID=UPI00259D56F5|nr:phage baseplate assembly protein V [Massilia sp. DJPM01]MDM5178516.1 phage baseplate assembly protein V [Massilia sp. DJPM01]